MTVPVRTDVMLLVLVSAGLGVLLGMVLGALSILEGTALSAENITPARYRSEREELKPTGTGRFGPDTAWPFYCLRQIRADLPRIWTGFRVRFRKLWKWPFPVPLRVIFFPVSIAGVICLVVAGVTGTAICGLFTLVAEVCVAVNGLCFAVAAGLMRGAERCWCLLRGAEASCPACYHVTPRPAYPCPRCSRLHRDLRPGRLGLFARRCGCGALLPTMTVRAAWKLKATCQRCNTKLARGAGAVRDIRIPIFGDTAAGKTRLLYAGLDSLMVTADRRRVKFRLADQDSKGRAESGLELIRSGRDTQATPTSLPVALTAQLGSGLGGTLLHLFDAAGAHFRGTQMHDALAFLSHGHGLVYVLDPLSIEALQEDMTRRNVSSPSAVAAGGNDPEVAYVEVVSHLRDSGVRSQSQRLAVVISKADLLADTGVGLAEDSAAIAAWLSESGVHNLVLSARRDFSEVRYFAVAAKADRESERYDPGAPLRWLLGRQGLRLGGPPPAGPRAEGGAQPRPGPDSGFRPPANDATAEART
jgi:hypothetical protein